MGVALRVSPLRSALRPGLTPSAAASALAAAPSKALSSRFCQTLPAMTCVRQELTCAAPNIGSTTSRQTNACSTTTMLKGYVTQNEVQPASTHQRPANSLKTFKIRLVYLETQSFFFLFEIWSIIRQQGPNFDN